MLFHEIKFNPHTHSLLPKTGIPPDGGTPPPFTCVLCPAVPPVVFAHMPKLISHYVLNHRQPHCSTCCTVLGTELDRLTHENSTHWPFRCALCRAEFFHPLRLEEHRRLKHSTQTCDLCDAVLATDRYVDHLRAQHDCLSSAFDLAIVSPVVGATAGGGGASKTNIAKFQCRLCGKVKLFANYQGHFLNHHKVRLNKFLELTLQFMQSYEELLHRIGGSGPSSSSEKNRDDATGSVVPKSTFADVADSFNVEKRNEAANGNDTAVVESKQDFDTSLVQFVASTDDDETSSEEADVAANSADAADPSDGRRRLLQCPYCETTSVFDRYALGKHLHTAHGFQVRNVEFRCHRCRRGFASRVSLQRHKQREHSEGGQHGKDAAGNRCCPFCEHIQGGRKALRMHIRQHVDRHDYPCPPNQLAHSCRYCPEHFWTVDQKNSHQMSRHTMQMPNDDLMLCRHCGITSSSKSFLTVHTAEAHASLTQLTTFVFKCAACLIAHSTIEDLRTHMLLVHPTAVSEYCTVANCRARIADGSTAAEHSLAMHAAFFAYICKVCGHRLLSKQGALKHFLVKHGATQSK